MLKLMNALPESIPSAPTGRPVQYFGNVEFLTASALGLVMEAHLAKTDAALLAAVVAGQGALGLVYVATRAGCRSGAAQ